MKPFYWSGGLIIDAQFFFISEHSAQIESSLEAKYMNAQHEGFKYWFQVKVSNKG